MFDIQFFKNSFNKKNEIVSGKSINKELLIEEFESLTSKEPRVFNIETTNYCNMKCKMCPRTSMMTRKLEHMEDGVFNKILDEIVPHNKRDLDDWTDFVSDKINILPGEKSENAFYFYICSKCVTLHGYGEPVLDPSISKRVKMLSQRGISTYFSCNPSNIRLDLIKELFEAGLGYIKFSMDSITDEGQKNIRGINADFTSAFEKILQVLDMKLKGNYQSTIVTTMIQMSKEQEDEVKRFLEIWKDKDVYSYIKSQDNQWYYKDEEAADASSHYERQYCEYPWTSLTIMADGTVVPCTQDYDTEIKMGNIKNNTLYEIWNSKKYRDFRAMHINASFPPGFKCSERCDQKLLCNYLKGGKE